VRAVFCRDRHQVAPAYDPAEFINNDIVSYNDADVFQEAREAYQRRKGIDKDKQVPPLFQIGLQVRVDLFLLRQALVASGLLGTKGKNTANIKPVTLEIQSLINGRALMDLLSFFDKRPDLARGFQLVSASHSTFIFSFVPLQPLKEIITRILYNASLSEGTYQLVSQEKNRVVLSYKLENPS